MNPSVLHVIARLSAGGAETQLKLLMRGLDQSGWRTGVVYLWDDPDFTERGSIEFHPVERGSKLGLLGLGYRIARAIDTFKPDIVHTWLPEILTIPAALHARCRDIPCLSSQRRSLRHALSLKSRLRDILIPINHLLASRVACNFSFAQEPAWVQRAIRARQGAVIRNGFQAITDPPSPQPEWLRTDTFKIMYVGRLVEQKRVDLLIKAAARLLNEGHQLQLGIYGQGSLESELRTQARFLGLSEGREICFMGYRPDWKSQAPHFDLFALPTLAEGMPNVLVEAMGMALPTLATTIFEISSFVRHGEDAWLVEPDSEAALVEGLRALISNPQLREKLSVGGHLLATSLSTEHMVQAYEALYSDMLHTIQP